MKYNTKAFATVLINAMATNSIEPVELIGLCRILRVAAVDAQAQPKPVSVLYCDLVKAFENQSRPRRKEIMNILNSLFSTSDEDPEDTSQEDTPNAANPT